MTGAAVPRFRDLSRDEAEAVLRRNRVGRIAYLRDGRADIVPIHYTFDEGWVYGRTAAGTKVEMLEHNRWVAFEVDESDGLFDWRSVVVRGGFYLLSPEGPDWEVEAWRTALEQVRRIVPEAGTEADPVPFRDVLFRIAAQEIEGRAASTTGEE